MKGVCSQRRNNQVFCGEARPQDKKSAVLSLVTKLAVVLRRFVLAFSCCAIPRLGGVSYGTFREATRSRGDHWQRLTSFVSLHTSLLTEIYLLI